MRGSQTSKAAGLKSAAVSDMIDAALAAVGEWQDLATVNGVDDETVERSADLLRALVP